MLAVKKQHRKLAVIFPADIKPFRARQLKDVGTRQRPGHSAEAAAIFLGTRLQRLVGNI